LCQGSFRAAHIQRNEGFAGLVEDAVRPLHRPARRLWPGPFLSWRTALDRPAFTGSALAACAWLFDPSPSSGRRRGVEGPVAQAEPLRTRLQQPELYSFQSPFYR
jgi:hypothetical protein